MAKNKKTGSSSGEDKLMGLGGFLGGLGTFLEKLGELAEKGEELRKSGEVRDAKGGVRAVYGFTIKTGLGAEQGVKVEPFGNVRQDEQTGRAVVHEVREPVVDLFEEKDHVLVVAEMPGIAEGDVQVDVRDDILTITAARGDKKYRKEVLLPGTFSAQQMTQRCQNGVLEIKLSK